MQTASGVLRKPFFFFLKVIEDECHTSRGASDQGSMG